MPVQVFGEVDRRKSDKKIISEFPAFYHKQQIEELKESIARKERALKRGDIPPSEIPYAREELRKESDRLEQIKEATPKLTDADKDNIHKIYKNLGGDISDSMFTRTDMEKGLASAHEEARRMTEPIIKLKTDKDIEFAQACGVEVSKDGMVSRNAASKMWKIAGRLIGEQTVVESLRKDGVKGR